MLLLLTTTTALSVTLGEPVETYTDSVTGALVVPKEELDPVLGVPVTRQALLGWTVGRKLAGLKWYVPLEGLTAAWGAPTVTEGGWVGWDLSDALYARFHPGNGVYVIHKALAAECRGSGRCRLLPPLEHPIEAAAPSPKPTPKAPTSP